MLAGLVLVVGGYGIVRAVVDGSSTASSEDSVTGDGPDSSDLSGSSESGAPSETSRSSQPTEGEDTRGSGTVQISGPTVDNVYPLERDDEDRYPATGGCMVMVNTDADISVTIRSIGVQGAGQIRISGEPCDTPAEGAVWNDLGVTDPVNACSPGMVLEPASVSPRHACNIRLDRASGSGAGTATLGVVVAARCTSRDPRPCSSLGRSRSPSAERPVTMIITTTITALFRGDEVEETLPPESPAPEESPETGEPQPSPTEVVPTEEGTPPEEIPVDSEAPTEGGT
ncbi:hypothetical protein [Streptosporangium sp. KLBMP 9127]|nr:hypothetical protein [Streptosporangium sp. KLBMP 9127]